MVQKQSHCPKLPGTLSSPTVETQTWPHAPSPCFHQNARLWTESACPCVWRCGPSFAFGRLGAGGWDLSPSSRVTCLVHHVYQKQLKVHRSVASRACASFFHHVPFPELLFQGEGCIGIIATAAPEGRPLGVAEPYSLSLSTGPLLHPLLPHCPAALTCRLTVPAWPREPGFRSKTHAPPLPRALQGSHWP